MISWQPLEDLVEKPLRAGIAIGVCGHAPAVLRADDLKVAGLALDLSAREAIRVYAERWNMTFDQALQKHLHRAIREYFEAVGALSWKPRL